MRKSSFFFCKNNFAQIIFFVPLSRGNINLVFVKYKILIINKLRDIFFTDEPTFTELCALVTKTRT